MSPSSSSTSARAVATSAYVRTPACWPFATRSLTSSSSWSSATDISFLSSKRGPSPGAGPTQTNVQKSKASVCVVKQSTAVFALTCQSASQSLPETNAFATRRFTSFTGVPNQGGRPILLLSGGRGQDPCPFLPSNLPGTVGARLTGDGRRGERSAG